MTILRILFLLVFCVVSYSETREEFTSQIESLRKLIQQTEGENSPQTKSRLSAYWLQLGIYLQARDVRYHSGGLGQVEALEAFNQALELSYGYASRQFQVQAYYYKGLLLKMMGRGEESIESYDEVLNLVSSRNDICSCYVNKADALVMISQLSEALALYRNALQLCPIRVSIFYPMASVYKELDNFTKSEWSSFLKEMEDHLVTVAITEAEESSESNDSNILPLIEKDTKSDVFWGMFLAAEKAGKLDVAWKYLTKAHDVELLNRNEPFSPLELNKQLQHVKNIFKQGFWIDGLGHESTVPIFIVGMMRSGSTLLETMLDSHKDIWGMGEDSHFNANLGSFRDEFVKAGEGATSLAPMKSVIKKHGDYVVKTMLEQARNYSANSGTKRLVRHVVDKMLFNYRNIGFIHLMFPNAPIIHMMRDPMDTIFSCYKHKFDDLGLAWSLNQTSLAYQYSTYVDTMHHFRTVLPNRVLDVRYEDLVAYPRKTLQRVIDYIDLSWDEGMLAYHESKRTVHTHSQSQVRHGLYKGAIGSWRKYATQLGDMRKILADLLSPLRVAGALPYESIINWQLDPNFNYNVTIIEEKSAAKTIVKPTKLNKAFNSKPDPKPTNMPLKSSNFSIELNKKQQNFHSSVEIGSSGHIVASKGSHIIISTNNFVSISNYNRSLVTSSQVLRKPTCSEVKKNYESLVHELHSVVIKDTKSSELAAQASSQFFNSSSSIGSVNEVSSDVERKLKELLSFEYITFSRRQLLNKDQIRNSLSVLIALIDAAYVLVNSCPENSNNVPNYYRGFKSNKIEFVEYIAAEIMNFDSSYLDYVLNETEKNINNLVSWHVSDFALYTLASVLSIENDQSKSLRVLNMLLKINPKHSQARRLRIDNFAKSQQFDKTISDLNILIDSHPDRNVVSPMERAPFYDEPIDLVYSQNITDTGFSKSSAYNLSIKSSDEGSLAELLLIRGNMFFSQSKYHSSYLDLFRSLKLMQPVDCSKLISQMYYLIGKCLRELGEWETAIEYQSYVLKCNEKDGFAKEAYHEIGVSLIDSCNVSSAIKAFDKAISLDENFKLAYGYKALTYHSMGRSDLAIDELNTLIKVSPQGSENNLQGQILRSTYLHSIGKFDLSIQAFNDLVKYLEGLISGSIDKRSNHTDIYSIKSPLSSTRASHDIIQRYITAWFRRELASYHYLHLDVDLLTFNIDDTFSKRIKQGHASQISDKSPLDVIQAELRLSYNFNISKLNDSFNNFPQATIDSLFSPAMRVCRGIDNNECSLNPCLLTPSDMSRIVSDTSNIANWIQVDSPGFILNERQHRQFGLAALEAAQALQRHAWANISSSAWWIPDSVSSKPNYVGVRKDGMVEKHVFGWRDLFDIVVRWRAISESNDVVWWIDRVVDLVNPDIWYNRANNKSNMPVGLSTYMVRGGGKVVRYYPYFRRAFNITKEYLLRGYAFNAREENFELDTLSKKRVRQSRTLGEIFRAMNSQSFFVVPRIRSSKSKRYLDGTRITLTASSLVDGLDYHICTASTLDRFLNYESEMNHVFESYLSALQSVLVNPITNEQSDKLLHESLTIFYYWVNYAPITRGTSATGYAVLYACLLAGGFEIDHPLPRGIQLDWEAILEPEPEAFILKAKAWIVLKQSSLPELYSVTATEVEFMNENFDVGMCNISASPLKSQHCSLCNYRVRDVFRTIRAMLASVNKRN